MIKFKLGIYFSLRPVSPSAIQFLGDKTITKTVRETVQIIDSTHFLNYKQASAPLTAKDN